MSLYSSPTMWFGNWKLHKKLFKIVKYAITNKANDNIIEIKNDNSYIQWQIFNEITERVEPIQWDGYVNENRQLLNDETSIVNYMMKMVLHLTIFSKKIANMI